FVNIRASFFYNCKVFNQVHWLRLAMGLALFDHKLAKSAIPPWGGSSGHWIQENIDSGKLIILEGDSI
ncbi:hypothetical protein, partial [Pseudoalteromonas peptidolytica]